MSRNPRLAGRDILVPREAPMDVYIATHQADSDGYRRAVSGGAEANMNGLPMRIVRLGLTCALISGCTTDGVPSVSPLPESLEPDDSNDPDVPPLPEPPEPGGPNDRDASQPTDANGSAESDPGLGPGTSDQGGGTEELDDPAEGYEEHDGPAEGETNGDDSQGTGLGPDTTPSAEASDQHGENGATAAGKSIRLAGPTLDATYVEYWGNLYNDDLCGAFRLTSHYPVTIESVTVGPPVSLDTDCRPEDEEAIDAPPCEEGIVFESSSSCRLGVVLPDDAAGRNFTPVNVWELSISCLDAEEPPCSDEKVTELDPASDAPVEVRWTVEFPMRWCDDTDYVLEGDDPSHGCEP